MKRTIELYIDGTRADLDANGLILMNYAFTDLEKPTAVKNSYSKQITLPGTPTNADIFGHIADPARRSNGGFNAMQKTPFTAYNAEGEKMLDGYLRLDSVTRRGNIVTGYKVTLFGGLGGFFYALAYDDNGNKRTLADLDYLGNGDAAELDFTINATALSDAWWRLYTQWSDEYEGVQQKWDVINFAPAYQGVPDGDFDPSKGIVDAASVGLQTSIVDGGETYKAQSGNTLVNLANAQDEWAAKDFRSYLQRPVLSMQAFMEAICNPANNGGYQVYLGVNDDISGFANIWKTLPTIPSLGTFKSETGTLSSGYAGKDAVDTYQVGQITITSSVASNMRVSVVQKLRLIMQTSTTPDVLMYTGKYNDYDHGPSNKRWRVYQYAITFLQMVAYSSNDVALGGSNVALLADIGTKFTPKQVAEFCGFTPWSATEDYDTAAVSFGEMGRESYSGAGWSGYAYGSAYPVTLKCEAMGAAYFKVFAKSYLLEVEDGLWLDHSPMHREKMTGSQATGAKPSRLLNGNPVTEYPTTHISTKSTSRTISYETSTSGRSGARVTKDMLLSTGVTPADYLIALCKEFGLVFSYDNAEKKIYIRRRDAFFNTGLDPIDLTNRVDRSKDITINPINAAARWYNLQEEMIEGQFAEEYNSIYGVDYGCQRVNTGYEFDAAEVDLMQGTPFKGVATIVDRNRYWNIISVSSKFRPSPFIDKGNTYTLWSQTDGKNKEFAVPGIPTNATISYYNSTLHGFDYCEKIELRDAENKPLDGADVLVFFQTMHYYSGFKITDDTAAMLALNDNKPCWDLNEGNGLYVPIFSRYIYNFDAVAQQFKIVRSLDYGIPRETQYPGIVFNLAKGSIYLRYWQQFLRDRLDQDTKVMKCRVDLGGLVVGQELLRRFFYYEGCIWVLNKINNYSLTTWDPAECEFIQVRDMENYTDGQILD